MDDRRGTRSLGFSLVGWLASLVAIGFLARWVVQLDASVWTVIGKLDWGWVALSLVLFLPFFAFRALAWEALSGAAGYQGRRADNWRMWAVSELARYIPGNVWSFVARYRGARSGGVPRTHSIFSLVAEAAALVSGAGLISAIALPLRPYGYIAWAVFIVATAALIWLPRILRRIRPTITPEKHQPLRLLALDLAAWACYGLAAAALWRAFPEHTLMSWTNAIGANVGAWLMGYLSLVTPMGLGVREITFVALVPAVVGAPLAGLAAIVTRLGMIAGEMLFLLAVLFWRKK